MNNVPIYLPPWSAPYNKEADGKVDGFSTYGVLPNFDIWDKGLSQMFYSSSKSFEEQPILFCREKDKSCGGDFAIQTLNVHYQFTKSRMQDWKNVYEKVFQHLDDAIIFGKLKQKEKRLEQAK